MAATAIAPASTAWLIARCAKRPLRPRFRADCHYVTLCHKVV
jgi:hypothetical protein